MWIIIIHISLNSGYNCFKHIKVKVEFCFKKTDRNYVYSKYDKHSFRSASGSLVWSNELYSEICRSNYRFDNRTHCGSCFRISHRTSC